MKKPHKHEEIIKAWADGAQVQYLNSLTYRWEDCVDNSPTWYLDTEYRIKPEPAGDSIFVYDVCPLNDFTGPKFERVFSLGTGNLKITFDGETGKLKAAEVIK